MMLQLKEEDIKKNRRNFRVVYLLILFSPFLGTLLTSSGYLMVWWLCYFVVAGMVPMILCAYLLFPAQDKLTRLLKVVKEPTSDQSTGKEDERSFKFLKATISQANEDLKQRFLLKKYFFPIVFISTVCFVGFFLLFSSALSLYHLEILDELILEIPKEFFSGFVGGFLFVLFSIVKRYRSADIPPGLILQLSYQIIIASVAAYFLSTLTPDVVDHFAAFAVGFIPYAVLTEYFRTAGSKRLQKPQDGEPDNTLLQAKIADNLLYFPGIAKEDSERLREEGVYTIHNLATANPLRLYILTSYTLSQLVGWINRAYLRTFLDSETIKRLAPMGIQGAIGLTLMAEEVLENGNEDLLEALANAFESTSDSKTLVRNKEVVKSLICRLKRDPRVSLLRKLWEEHGSN